MTKARPYLSVKNSPYVITYVPNLIGKDFKDILELMLHGVDICLVDPEIFAHLDSVLSSYMDHYKQIKDQLVISKLEFYKKYIDELPRRQEIAALLSKEPPPPPVVIPALTPEQVSQEIDLILNTGKIKYFKPDELDLILEGLRKKRVEFINESRYLDAQKAEHFSRAVMSYGQLGFVEKLHKSKASDIQVKLGEAKAGLHKKKTNCRILHTNLRSSANDDLLNLQRSQQKEIEELEMLYESVPPPSIKKYSNALLSLKRREQAMIKARLFSKAGQIQKELDDLERQENEQHETKWKEEIDQRIRNLRKKQEKEMFVRRNFWRKEELQFVNLSNSEVEKDEKAIRHLEKNLEITQNAKLLVEHLKNDSKNVKEVGDSFTLPHLDQNRESMSRATAHRQRAILNSKIYTRLPRPHSSL